MEDVDNSSAAAVLTHENERRAKNLNILKTYIQRQRTILERIKLDIDNLQKLREPAEENPPGTFKRILSTDINDEVGDERTDGLRLERIGALVREIHAAGGGVGGAMTITDSLDWTAFENYDVTPLFELARASRRSHSSLIFLDASMAPPPTPSSAKHPPVETYMSRYPPPRDSALRVLVRESKAKMIDPVLVQCEHFLASLPPDSDEECAKAMAKSSARSKGTRKNGKHSSHSHAQRRRRQENAAAAAVRPRGPGGVFIKRGTVFPPATTAQSPGIPKSVPSTPLCRMSSVSSMADVDGGDWHGTDRSRRERRPSIRILDGASISTTIGRGKGKGKIWNDRRSTSTSTSSASPAPETQPTRGRLTIRIPPRPTMIWSQNETANELICGFPSSTNVSVTTSTSTSYGSVTATPEQPAFAALATPRFASPAEQWKDVMNVDEEKSVDERVHRVKLKLARCNHRQEQLFKAEEDEPALTPYDDDEDGEEEVSAAPVHASTSSAKPSHVVPPVLKKGKAKSETFKHPWSVAEQHHLDQLLEQYPDGTTNRWSMISKAMDGRRTPRQVASRVQKYFAKMKKFGLEVK